VDMRWREAQQPEWRAAMRAVLAAEKSGDLTEAESAITHALTVNGLLEQADQ
jgi:hypothetical protein